MGDYTCRSSYFSKFDLTLAAQGQRIPSYFIRYLEARCTCEGPLVHWMQMLTMHHFRPKCPQQVRYQVLSKTSLP